VDQLKPFVSDAKALRVSNVLVLWRYYFRCLPFGSNSLPNPAVEQRPRTLKATHHFPLYRRRAGLLLWTAMGDLYRIWRHSANSLGIDDR
jgi:hypothetical protein